MLFKKIYVEITNNCNMACSFCKKSSRKKEFLSKERFLRIIEQIKPFTKHIYLHVLGEPTLHPELQAFLEICAANNFEVSITTNATLIAEKGKILRESGVIRQINYSLHSLFENRPNENFTPEEKLSKILDFVLSSPNFHHCLRFWNIENEINPSNRSLFELIEKRLSLSEPIPEKLTKGNGLRILPNIFVQIDEVFEWPCITNEKKHFHGRCHAIKNHVGILVDGTVVPCCLDAEGDIPLDNIFTDDFKNIIENERTKKIKEGFSANSVVEPLCQTCGFLERLNKPSKYRQK